MGVHVVSLGFLIPVFRVALISALCVCMVTAYTECFVVLAELVEGYTNCWVLRSGVLWALLAWCGTVVPGDSPIGGGR